VFLNVLIDGRFKEDMLWVWQVMMDYYGVSKASGDARDASGVKINTVDSNGNAVTTMDTQSYYGSVGIELNCYLIWVYVQSNKC